MDCLAYSVEPIYTNQGFKVIFRVSQLRFRKFFILRRFTLTIISVNEYAPRKNGELNYWLRGKLGLQNVTGLKFENDVWVYVNLELVLRFKGPWYNIMSNNNEIKSKLTNLLAYKVVWLVAPVELGLLAWVWVLQALNSKATMTKSKIEQLEYRNEAMNQRIIDKVVKNV